MGFILSAVAVLLVASSPSEQKQDCVEFSSKLSPGVSFAKEIFPGLEFRLDAEAGVGWNISVRERGAGPDLMWVVSPPFQTAPHRMIGRGYGLSVRESVAIERSLRFVLSRKDYDVAEAIVRNETAGSDKLTRLAALGQGTLSIKITNFAIEPSGRSGTADALAWIEFEARACKPDHR